MCGAALLVFGVTSVTPCRAAEIPAWLDDAITDWNTKHPDTPIQFVDIKDSFVWYKVSKTADVSNKQIRSRVHEISLANNYVPLRDEESVTTARPPVSKGATSQKKCWTRSYQKGTKPGTVGQQTSMLTTYVCDDSAQWWAAFRVAQ